jgi:hypothetical protein
MRSSAGIGIVAVNAVIYAFAWRRSRLDPVSGHEIRRAT